jgi:hypothetical protein
MKQIEERRFLSSAQIINRTEPQLWVSRSRHGSRSRIPKHQIGTRLAVAHTSYHVPQEFRLLSELGNPNSNQGNGETSNIYCPLFRIEITFIDIILLEQYLIKTVGIC